MAYPASLDSFTTNTDDVDDVLAADVNELQAAIVAIETELGTDPAGTAATIKARLAVSLDDAGYVEFTDATELTITGGAITKVGNYHRVDTEADASSDYLVTINGGSAGDLLILRSESSARDIIFDHNAGNIYCTGGADFTLANENELAVGIYDGALSKWIFGKLLGATGASITVQELDGAPAGAFDTIKFPNTSLTDNGDGSVTYALANHDHTGDAGDGGTLSLAGVDSTAIHDNQASEIVAVTLKASPVAADVLLIEDSEASYVKKRAALSTIPATDATAIHDNQASEIYAVTAKASPVAADLVLIEDSEASFVKKKVQAGNLPTTDAAAIHDNEASEIVSITEKVTPASTDVLLIEDSEASYVKKMVQITNLPGGGDADAIHDNEASEIVSITEKTALAAADVFLIEDSEASYVKKYVQVTNMLATDTTAIHDDEASEIVAITEKASPASTDVLLIEDSEASYVKKRVQITNLPGGGDADAIHDNEASEIYGITEKASPASTDVLIIEDSEASYVKKRVQITNLPGGGDADAIHDNEASEIVSITEKAAPVAGDVFLIEDSEASYVKKYAQLGNLPNADAADLTYTPNTLTDWDSDADPGDIDQALDQLAERVDDLEGAGRFLISQATPSSTNTVTFSSIPSTYWALRIEAVIRSTRASNGWDLVFLYFNNDQTAANYRYSRHGGRGSTTNFVDGDNLPYIGVVAADSSPANSCGQLTIDVINYTGTTFNKQAIALSSYREDASSIEEAVMQNGMEWENAAAVTQLDLVLVNGNYVSGSVVRLYGVF